MERARLKEQLLSIADNAPAHALENGFRITVENGAVYIAPLIGYIEYKVFKRRLSDDDWSFELESLLVEGWDLGESYAFGDYMIMVLHKRKKKEYSFEDTEIGVEA